MFLGIQDRVKQKGLWVFVCSKETYEYVNKHII